MPLVLSQAEFDKLVSWVDGSRENKDAARQSEYVKHLNDQSSWMTRKWPNSFENVNKRNEELRRARVEAAEQANSKFYKKYMRQKRDEQARLMYSARDTIFKNKDAPKMFLRAVIETCVQKEREEQLKFKAERKREEKEQKRKDDEEIHRRAAEWHALMATRRQRRFEADKQHQKEILEQAHEVAERQRTEHETELNYQIIDNIKADEQMDALREFQHNFNIAEKARILADMKQSKAELDARRAEEQARDQLDDKLIAVLQRSRARTQAMRKKTEKDTRDEQLRVLEMNSKRLASGESARAEKEQANLEAAIREKEAVAEARRRKDKEKEARFRREKQEVQDKFLADEARRLHELDTQRQWEMMNRFKNQELYDDYKEKLRQEKARKIKEFREDTLRLWKERDERDARELAETRYFYGELAERKLRDADNRLFAHAQELLAEARRNKRPDYALRKALDRYCVLNRLYPMPELSKTVQSHFPDYRPKDSCIPDPGYKPPPPPEPEDASPRATGKRSGLQPAHDGDKASASAIEENVADYMRAGRADGLQRTAAEADQIKLQPITVPCEATGSCTYTQLVKESINKY
ncbi:trichohyalin-like isoform X2 [Leguminivora glycinivorella]|uniref:trichohyalin-like isoform X2 n=1 Tax=Leguminivora glycinivorella TaxID=1035111 RepID=UPI00200EC4D5|nr:trichohyalin-like isoform X2 [Leguminivora glycinivorella]